MLIPLVITCCSDEIYQLNGYSFSSPNGKRLKIQMHFIHWSYEPRLFLLHTLLPLLLLSLVMAEISVEIV